MTFKPYWKFVKALKTLLGLMLSVFPRKDLAFNIYPGCFLNKAVLSTIFTFFAFFFLFLFSQMSFHDNGIDEIHATEPLLQQEPDQLESAQVNMESASN